MSQSNEIQAKAREKKTKGYLRAMGREGFLAGVIYGAPQEPENVFVSLKDLTLLHERGRLVSHIFGLKINGKTQKVIVRDVQQHPVKDNLLHVDFLRVSQDSRIEMDIAFAFINRDTCPGLKDGGALNIVRHDVRIACSPDSVPEHITIDLSSLELGDSMHIRNLILPAGVEMVSPADLAVVSVVAPSNEEAPSSTEEGEEAAPAATTPPPAS